MTGDDPTVQAGNGIPSRCVDLDGAVVAEWRDARHRTVSASTVNRELNLIGAAFTRALRSGAYRNPSTRFHDPKATHARTRGDAACPMRSGRLSSSNSDGAANASRHSGGN
jgi:hypothetical protein